MFIPPRLILPGRAKRGIALGGAFHANASSDSITTSSIALGAGAFTVSIWAYITSSTRQILSNDDTGNDGPTVYISSGSLSVSTFNRNVILGGSGVTNDAWHHLVWCRDGSNNMALFVDGTRKSTSTDSSNFPSGTGTNQFKLGGATTSGQSISAEYLDEVCICVGSTIWDPTSSTLTVPTEPFNSGHPNYADFKLLAHLDNATPVDSSPVGHSLNVNGTAEIQFTTVKF